MEALKRIREIAAPRVSRFNAVRLIEFALAFLFGIGGGKLAPFGPAAVCAAWIACKSPWFALCGGIAGAAVAAHYESVAASALFMTLGLSFMLWRLRFGRRMRMADKLLLLAVSQLILLPFFYFETLESCMFGLIWLFLSFISAAALSRGGSAFKAFIEGRRLAEAEYMALLLFMFVLLVSIGNYTLYVSFAAILASFLALCAVRARGAAGVAGAVLLASTGLFAGGIYAHPPSDVIYVGIFALAALAASAVSRWGRWAAAGAFLGTWAAGTCVLSMPLAPLIEAAVGTVAFAALPARAERGLIACLSHRASASEAERALAHTRAQLHGAAGVIREVSDLFAAALDGQSAFTRRQLRGVSSVLERLAGAQAHEKRRNYDVKTGAALCPKAGNNDTGDSIGIREVNGHLLLILSDGMGTGTPAHRESAAAVAMFGDLLSVGFDIDEAHECVNRLMMLRSDGEMYATLDALMFDLSDACARFIKYGAPPSYILRGGKVHTIYAEALPIGILSEAVPCIQQTALRRGDTVVMMTDGVPDALGSELFAAMIEKVGGANTADDAADALLQAAKELSGADDMSVVVARIS